MNKYTKFIKKNRKKLLILLIVLNILAIIGITRINFSATFDIFKIDDSKYQETLDEMEKVFGGNNQILLLIESDKENQLDIYEHIEEILKTEEIKNFTSPLMLLEMIDTNKFDNLEDSFNSLKEMSPVIYKDEKAYGTFFIDSDENYRINDLEKKLNDFNIIYYMSGNPFMESEIVKMVFSILLFIPPCALIIILIVFRTQLSSLKATILSVLPAGLAALWTLGLIGWLGGEVSIITVLAPVFSIVIGSADGLHFISHIEEEMNINKTNEEALVHTLSIVGIPMIITTTTSMAGFIGLLLINTQAIQSLAIFASLGVFLAGIVTWYVLPVILTSDIRLEYIKKERKSNYLKNLWGIKSIIIAIVLVFVSVLFIPNIKSEFNQLMFFRNFTEVQKNFNKILEINDGAIPLYYFGNTTLDNKDETFNNISILLKELSTDENVSKVTDPTSILNNIKQPSVELLNSAKNFIRVKDNKLYYRLMIFPKDLENNTIDNIFNITKKYNDSTNGELVGVQFSMREMNNSIVSGQIKSVIFTFILIFIMLMITFKSLKISIISSLPILFTSIILYGFLGFSQISLNVVTCTIFSITLGIGIDYAIHYTSVYKYFNELGEANPRSLALKYTQRPIIANALGLSLGLSVLLISPLKIHLYVSALMWVSMLVSVFMSLTLLPTLLEYKSKK